uniref:Amino acid transporter transmembrane domain-containing protein n=1 Tax=Favella ehrenbergii TaxID=182087 RepID=A0A7S3I794_9SPIT|mmetsp:Transcript_5101/g.6255  ORF Transcript_5101/g.6255 Transcript_5101/m.6255 type:complete len:211 (+) Transcript_5101:1081-1713(+)
MFLTSNVISSILLFTEGILAFLAFSGLTNSCTPDHGETEFPCEVSKLYNENFLGIPVIGQICQFYPMLNVSAVPILTITLRNNFMQVVPVKRWIRNSNCGCLMFLLDDKRRLVKGVWSFIFSLPVIIIVMFERDPQIMISYTGGICGPFILFLIPITLVWYGRKKLGEANEQNFNRSPYQALWLIIVMIIFAFLTLFMALYGAATGKSGE